MAWYRQAMLIKIYVTIYGVTWLRWANVDPGNSLVPTYIIYRVHDEPVHHVLMFSLICAWINDWVNNREAGDLRRHRAHYYVTVMADTVYQTIPVI